MGFSFSRRLATSYIFVSVVTFGIAVLFVASPLNDGLWKAFAAAMGVCCLVAFISVHKVNQPLRDLIALAGRVGSGDRAPALPLESRDEFGQLARAFTEMSHRVDGKVQELVRERMQLQAMLSALVESIIALDHQGRVMFLNPAAEQLFGVSHAEAKGRTFLEALRQSPLNDVLTQSLTEHRTVQKEILLHTPKARVLSVTAVTIDFGGQERGVLAALYDMTDLRKLENLRREFVANVSHELKTPLTAIRGYADTLLAGALSDPKDSREFVGIIAEHANSLSALIDDVLDLSAIEAQRMIYRFEPVDIKEVLDRLLKALGPAAKARIVTLPATIPAGLPKVRADREKLIQILMNLLDNAIKFNSSPGEVRIGVQPKGAVLELEIRDSGRGIAPEDLPRIFERFYRGNKDRSHQIPGTGLGLAIVKHLVEAHQGTIVVESTVDRGTTVRLTLPLAGT